MKKVFASEWTVILLFALGFGVYMWWSRIPTAPITPTFRTSQLSGLVLQVQNNSDKNLSCKMDVWNETQNQHADYSFALDPRKLTEIGLLECNWEFQHGETVLIKTEGYKDIHFTVP